MGEPEGNQKTKAFYDQKSKNYIKQYRAGNKKYPNNLIRLNFIVQLLRENNTKSILDAGCGTCGPMLRFLEEGFDVKGFDFSRGMVETGKEELKKAGYSPDLICTGDLLGLDFSFLNQKFDSIVATGVFPHIEEEKIAIANLKSLLNKNGSVFIEFRNDLFSMFSLNQYSMDFMLNRMLELDELPSEIQDEVISYFSQKFEVDTVSKSKDVKLHYTDILARFHNPLTISKEIFEPCGFKVKDIHFYHYHALPPVFDKKYPQLFRDQSLKLEKTNSWKGYFMSSAFVIEALKQ
jgi:cyclopropane fatty-acyl-phospholipid synthase-like methyltransferase